MSWDPDAELDPSAPVFRDAGGGGAGSEVVVTPTTPVPEADEG